MTDTGSTKVSAKVSARAWVGLAVRMIVFPALFLLPAGTWRWWEAWALIGLWVIYSVALTAYLVRHDPALLAERMKTSPVQTGQKGWDKMIMLLMYPVGVAIYVIPGLDVMRFGWSVPLPMWVEVLALALTVPGLLVIAWVMQANTYLSRVVKIDAARDQQVITSGPYAIVRHPMYTAAILLGFTAPLALGSRYGLIPAALFAVLLIVRTVLEDSALRDELAGYADYAGVVRYRLVPGLW